MFAGWSQETPARTADEFNFASLIDVLDTVFIDFHDSRIEGLSAAGVEIVGNTNNAVIVASDLRSARIRSVGQFAIVASAINSAELPAGTRLIECVD